MLSPPLLSAALLILGTVVSLATPIDQTPLLYHARTSRAVSPALFQDLEELARVVDISYCVGLTSFGIAKPFSCLSRCKDFPEFELLTTWNTGPLMSDSCGYVALDHGQKRVVVAFRGTYSIANTVVDLSTIPQEYVPYPGSDDDGDGDGDGDGGGDGDGDDDDGKSSWEVTRTIRGRVGSHARRVATSQNADKCANCTVHMGFHTSWLITRSYILPELEKAAMYFPDYRLTLVGHSLGGAVAALAGLDLQARGYEPQITTFGEPRIGNVGLVKYLDRHFALDSKKDSSPDDDVKIRYRRVTHVDDPVPLLPLTEWGFAMHAGEIYISKPALSPDIADLQFCSGDNDGKCIAGQDSTISQESALLPKQPDLLASVKHEVSDLQTEPWGIPSRYKLWQLFFAHRDYFWRLGLCVPGGDPLGGGEKYTV